MSCPQARTNAVSQMSARFSSLHFSNTWACERLTGGGLLICRTSLLTTTDSLINL